MHLAVLGTPIQHSRSPQLHQAFAKECGIALSYERIETNKDTLLPTMQRLRQQGYRGFNCTMPLKTEMAFYADAVSDETRQLCSANTVTIEHGKFYASTTDGMGLIYGMEHNGITVKNATVLLLGAGGAARSIALSLIRYGVASLILLNRTIEGAASLAQMLHSPNVVYDTMTPENQQLYAKNADILIHATPLGMEHFAQHSDFTFLSQLQKHASVVEAVYCPLETELLFRSKTIGLHTVTGLWMLLYQGVLAFQKWTGILPEKNAINMVYHTLLKDITQQ